MSSLQYPQEGSASTIYDAFSLLNEIDARMERAVGKADERSEERYKKSIEMLVTMKEGNKRMDKQLEQIRHQLEDQPRWHQQLRDRLQEVVAQRDSLATADIPAFTLGPPESDVESGCESGALSSDVSSSGYDSDANGAVAAFPEPARSNTADSDRTVVLNGKKRKAGSGTERSDLAEATKESNSEKSRVLEDSTGPQTTTEKSIEEIRSTSTKFTAERLTAERPKPAKHISWRSMLPHHPRKSTAPTPTDSSDNTAAGSGALSPQIRSTNTSSTSLASLGEHKRSHSAKSLKGLTEGLSHFSIVERDPRKMQSVDATLANEMVFGGLKKRAKSRSRERERKAQDAIL